MPQVFKIGSYHVYFWSKENEPLEPIHVSQYPPSANATKIWITRAGRCYLCHNHSHIPTKALRNIIKILEARSTDIIEQWQTFFDEISFYC